MCCRLTPITDVLGFCRRTDLPVPVWPGGGFVPSVVGIDMLMSASVVERSLPAPSTAAYTIVPPPVRVSPAPRVTDLDPDAVQLTEDDLQIPRNVSAVPIIDEFHCDGR